MNKNKATEATERIVIDYANLAGRETANRAEFRKRTKVNIDAILREQKNEILKDVEKLITKLKNKWLK